MSTNPIDQAVAYARSQHGRFLDQFVAFLRIPSISTDPGHRPDIQAAAGWLVGEMERIGLDHCQAIPSDGAPAVYGDWLHAGPDRPTLLVYAHYDVQPVDPLPLWLSPPFEPAVRDGRLYARGVIDDKCGVFFNLKAVEAMLATAGALPVNVKFFFEGEEESGSPSMEPVVRAYREQLAADLILLCDGATADDQPTLSASLRGMVAAEVTITGPRRDLHSGSYGGVVLNPAHVAARIIAAAQAANGRIQIPGFYDAVRPLSAAQQAELAELEAAALRRAREETGHETFWGEPDYPFLVRGTARPTFEVNGLTSGYQGPGVKTIIPAQASFKVTMRLVADQDPVDIAARFTAFVQQFAVAGVTIDVRRQSYCWPAEIDTAGPGARAVQRAYEATWGRRALLRREGGSIPVAGMFQQLLGAPVTALGLGNGDNAHAPNEYFDLRAFDRNVATAVSFYHFVAEEMA